MSVKKIVMPKLGESVTEGTINAWLVKVGDKVNKYDPIAEVMTDKVNAEVPSSYSGTITEILVEEGETVAVNDVICKIETDEIEKGEVKEKDEPIQENMQPATPSPAVASSTANQARYSPAVMRLASEHGIDLSSLVGTGLGGRITRKDILSVIEGQADKRAESKEEKPLSRPAIGEDVEPRSEHDRLIPVQGVRKAIADKMVRSKTEIPHAWMTVEVDVTDLVAYRNKVKDAFQERNGYPLTYFAFFVYAVATALKEYPALNSSWAGDKIVEHKAIHLSIAVASDQELFVPVIKDADEKNIKGIAKAIYELADKARKGKLTQADMTGGTFTVNNTGTFGSVSSMGIINYPQAAILQVEAIVKRPVIIDDMFAARDMVNLSLSLDHRILDGLICGRFLARVKSILETMNEETIDL